MTDGMATILIVDDDRFSARLLSLRLEHAGYRVRVAADAATALRALGEELPDLIILDLLMPGLNGAQLAEQVRHDPRTACIPLLMVTAASGAETLGTIAPSGVDAVLPKPIDAAQLHRCVEWLLTATPHA